MLYKIHDSMNIDLVNRNSLNMYSGFIKKL